MMNFFGGGGLVGGGGAAAAAAPAPAPTPAAAPAPDVDAPPSRAHHHDQDGGGCCHGGRHSDHAGSEHDSHDSAVPCWICLEAGAGDDCEMLLPCKCPRPVHPKCLARWQLQSAGKTEETRCRFCETVLPDWRGAFTPPDLAPAVPVMSIHFNDSTYWLQVHPGADGLERFQGDVRKLLGLTDDQAFDITFECKVPGSGSRMELRGLSAFDAAVYCASITAAERVKTKPAAAKGAGGGGGGAGGGGGRGGGSVGGGLLGPALSSLPSTAIGVGMYVRSGSGTEDENEGPLQQYGQGGSGSGSVPATLAEEEGGGDGDSGAADDGDDGDDGAEAAPPPAAGPARGSPSSSWSSGADAGGAAAAAEAPVPAAPAPRPSVTDKLLAPVRSWAMRLARPM